MAGRVLVVGFGSGLVADDGIGPAVIRRLEALGPVPGVRVEHGGQDSLRLIGLWRGEPEVWLVDAIVRGAPPGTVHCLGHEELLAIPQQHGTAHQLSLPETLVAEGVHAVAVRADKGAAAAMPEFEAIAYGSYPLYHYLYAASLANGSVRGAMFVTHLTSDRGQRQIERAGFLPARQTARAIVITDHPLGETGSKEDQ